LVVLRVAEVAAFQEKLCRAVAEGGEGFAGPEGYSVRKTVKRDQEANVKGDKRRLYDFRGDRIFLLEARRFSN
jgi:hypothetical protein